MGQQGYLGTLPDSRLAIGDRFQHVRVCACVAVQRQMRGAKSTPESSVSFTALKSGPYGTICHSCR